MCIRDSCQHDDREDHPIDFRSSGAEQVLAGRRAVMAPAQYGGVGEQQNRDGHKGGSQKTEMIAEGVAHQGAGLDGSRLAGQLSCLLYTSRCV